MQTLTPHLVNHRAFTAFPSQALLNQTHHNSLFDLSYLGVVDVVGASNRDFLQGQLSCDVREVAADQMRQAAMCNLKGRVLMLLDVLEYQGLHLILPRDLRERCIRLLEKPAALSRVTLQPSETYALFGFHLQNPEDSRPFDWELPIARFAVATFDEGCCYHLGDGAYIVLTEASSSQALLEPFVEKKHYYGSLAWHALRIQQGQFDIYPESSGLFLPHRLDLHLSGHLHFNKGCYKGQEIIARTHFRATLKHTMKRFKIQTTEPLRAGLKLFSTEGQVEIGELIDFCPLGDNVFLIAASMVFEHADTCLLEGQARPVFLLIE